MTIPTRSTTRRWRPRSSLAKGIAMRSNDRRDAAASARGRLTGSRVRRDRRTGHVGLRSANRYPNCLLRAPPWPEWRTRYPVASATVPRVADALPPASATLNRVADALPTPCERHRAPSGGRATPLRSPQIERRRLHPPDPSPDVPWTAYTRTNGLWLASSFWLHLGPSADSGAPMHRFVATVRLRASGSPPDPGDESGAEAQGSGLAGGRTRSRSGTRGPRRDGQGHGLAAGLHGVLTSRGASDIKPMVLQSGRSSA